MTTYENRIEQLARMVLGRGGAIALNMLKVYAEAAGVEVLGGGWLRLPGERVADAQGWRQFAARIIDAPAEGRWRSIIRGMANAAAEAEDAMRPPEIPGLAGTPILAADLNRVPASQATADDLLAVAKHVTDLASSLAAIAPPPPPAPASVETVAEALRGAENLDLPDLGHLSEAVAKRVVRRAAYDMGRALLDVLAGWIEGAAENTAAGMGSRDADPEQFHADDIRHMVNDACRAMGAPEAYRPEPKAADR